MGSDSTARAGGPAEWLEPVSGFRLLKRETGSLREVQLFGQRCSGTNVFAKLVAANFGADALTDRFGFKHWFVPEEVQFPADVLVLVIARDARDWIRSLHRQPWHAHPDLKALSFPDFIRAEWHSRWDEDAGFRAGHPMYGREMLHERDPATGRRFANPLAKRTAKLRAWADLAGRASNVGFLDSARLLADAPGVVAALGDALGRAPSADYAPAATYKGNGFRAFAPTVYPDLSADDAAYIRASLDPEVEGRYGFAVA